MAKRTEKMAVLRSEINEVIRPALLPFFKDDSVENQKKELSEKLQKGEISIEVFQQQFQSLMNTTQVSLLDKVLITISNNLLENFKIKTAEKSERKKSENYTNSYKAALIRFLKPVMGKPVFPVSDVKKFESVLWEKFQNKMGNDSYMSSWSDFYETIPFQGESVLPENASITNDEKIYTKIIFDNHVEYILKRMCEVIGITGKKQELEVSTLLEISKETQENDYSMTNDNINKWNKTVLGQMFTDAIKTYNELPIDEE